jgi:short subunit dehydrogenase-like uncharacterized protein
MSAKYDIVVFGATGYTGQMAAEFLAEKIHQGAKFPTSAKVIAIAGRNVSKLESVNSTIKNRFGITFDIIKADTGDEKSIEDMVKQTRVVITTAGPYIKHGPVVVRYCAQYGVQYCDITGEAIFVKDMINQYDATAVKNNALILSMCGFDCVPFDICTTHLAEQVRAKYNAGLGTVQTTVKTTGGGISGGTFQTILAMMESTKDKSALMDPYYLNPKDDKIYPPGKTARPQDKENYIPIKDSVTGNWLSYSPFSATDTKVVRRTARLYEKIGQGFGPKFTYLTERLEMPTIIHAIVTTVGMLLFVILASIPFTRNLLKKYGPQSGDGPSPATRDKTRMQVTVRGQIDGASGGKKSARVILRGGDLGYYQTSHMVSVVGLLLAYQKDKLKVQGGVVTPGFALGSLLVDSLNQETEIKITYED